MNGQRDPYYGNGIYTDGRGGYFYVFKNEFWIEATRLYKSGRESDGVYGQFGRMSMHSTLPLNYKKVQSM